MQILEDYKNSDIVAWKEEMNQFTIKDVNHFSNIILPRYFKDANLNSFVRQLNYYGFTKKSVSKNELNFHHKNLVKNNFS